MKLHLDDTGEKTKLVISRGEKSLLKRKGRSIRSLLKFVFDGTTKQSVKDSIMSLQPMLELMKNSKTTIQIKED